MKGVLIMEKELIKTDDLNLINYTKWEALQAETQRVLALLDNGDEELTPDDIKDVRALKRELDMSIKEYNKRIRQTADNYKQLAEEKLEEIGYPRIEAFVEQKKQEHKNELNQRINTKQAKFRALVEDALDKTEFLSNLSIAAHFEAGLLQLFPDVSSGAKNKENMDEETISKVINHIFKAIETNLTELPKSQWVIQLPPQSNTLRLVMDIIRTGDLKQATSIADAYKQDQYYIEDLQLMQAVTSTSSALAVIQAILNSDRDEETKLAYIRRISQLSIN